MSLEVYVLFSLALFSLGLYAVLARRNLIAILIGIELMLNAASVNFLAFNYYLVEAEATTGQIVVLFIIGLAAAEAAIALSVILAVYRRRTAIDVDALDELKG